MNCPSCRRQALCIDSRGSLNNSRKRRYQCTGLTCKTRFSTSEQIVDDARQARMRVIAGAAERINGHGVRP